SCTEPVVRSRVATDDADKGADEIIGLGFDHQRCADGGTGACSVGGFDLYQKYTALQGTAANDAGVGIGDQASGQSGDGENPRVIDGADSAVETRPNGRWGEGERIHH